MSRNQHFSTNAMRNLARLLVVGIAMFGWQAQLHASPSTDALFHFFKEIKTFKAGFSQIVLDENLSAIDESRGSVWVQRPGRFRWNYAEPDPQEIVGDGESVWLYDVALEQVTERNQAEALGRAPAVLLAGKGDLNETYDIQDLGRQGQIDWVNLIPKEEGSFTEIRVGFKDGKISLMELIDALDQRTRISFYNLTENVKISAKVFKFVPPSGVDIIEQPDP